MRFTWYQGRMYVVFNFPGTDTATILIYPDDKANGVSGYRYVGKMYLHVT